MSWPEAIVISVAIIVGLPILIIVVVGIIMIAAASSDEKKDKEDVPK